MCVKEICLWIVRQMVLGQIIGALTIRINVLILGTISYILDSFDLFFLYVIQGDFLKKTILSEYYLIIHFIIFYTIIVNLSFILNNIKYNLFVYAESQLFYTVV